MPSLFRTLKMNLHRARTLAWLVILLAIFQPSVGQSPDEGLRNFFTQAILAFPDWMIANGKHLPISSNTPLILMEDTGFISINGTIKTQHAENYITPISLQSINVYSNLLTSFFGATFSSDPGIILDGEYELEGSVYSTFPIEGSGRFSAGNQAHISFRSDFYTFNVVNDHVVFAEDNTIVQAYLQSEELQFEGLNAGGYELTVTDQLRSLYRIGGSSYITNAISDDLLTYLKNTFAETKLSDIIKTLPPPTTPNPDPTTDNPTHNPDPTNATTTTTTQSPSSTIDPLNPCQIFDNLGKAKVTSLVENMLKNITVKENGKLVTYTKKMVIMELREEQCDNN